MSDDDDPRPNTPMPTIFWGILGILAVALFVLVMGVLSPH